MEHTHKEKKKRDLEMNGITRCRYVEVEKLIQLLKSEEHCT